MEQLMEWLESLMFKLLDLLLGQELNTAPGPAKFKKW